MENIWSILEEIKDPEIPVVSVVEMGMIHSVNLLNDEINISFRPTFVGCPALDIIKKNITDRLLKLEFVNKVNITVTYDPPWSCDLITKSGIEKLRKFGLSVQKNYSEVPACPYCNALNGKIENLFGPSACRSIYYCYNCSQPFEAMKAI